MKNSITIPENGTKDARNLQNLLSSMNDREIQEIYTYVRIKNLSEEFTRIAVQLLDVESIQEADYKLIEEHQKELAIHFMDIQDWNIPKYDLMKDIIEAFLTDMRNRPVVMIAQHNRELFVRKFKNLLDAQKVMLEKIEIIMGDDGIEIDKNLPYYKGIYCNWDATSAQINFTENVYDWKIVYEADIPSNF